MITTDPFTYGAVQYGIVTDESQMQTPVPMPAKERAWIHIPYGGNVLSTAGSLHTTWTVRIEIAAADIATFKGYHENGFRALTVPSDFGSTKYAWLVMGDMAYDRALGIYRGSVTFEWA